MGNTDTKLNFRKAVIQLTTKTEPVEATDDSFWDQFWSESVSSVQDVFTLVPSTEIRALREESPSNLATLCYKAVEKLIQAADASCRTQKDQIQVLNSVRLLTRLIPYMFEDPEWRNFFWSSPTSKCIVCMLLGKFKLPFTLHYYLKLDVLTILRTIYHLQICFRFQI